MPLVAPTASTSLLGTTGRLERKAYPVSPTDPSPLATSSRSGPLPDADDQEWASGKPSDEVLLKGPPEHSRKFLLTTSIVCFLAWVFSVYDFVLFGTLLPEIAKTFEWSTSTATAVATWVTLGTFFVSLAVGPLLDRVGRKPALVFCTVGAALTSGLTGLANGALALIGIRAISGLGYSEEVVNSVYLNEIYGKSRRRGFMFSFVQSGWPVGALLASAFAAALLPFVEWRWIFVLATFPAIVVVFLARRLRESPAFIALRRTRELRKEGRANDAERLAALYDLDITRDQESGLRQIFAPDLRRHTICLSAAWLLNWMGIQVFAVLGTTILTDGKGVSFGNALLILIVSNAAGFLGYLAHGYVGDRVNRRTTIMVGWIIGGAVMTVMLFGPNNAGFVIPLYALGIFFLNGPYAAMLFYMSESFPARVRGTGPNAAHIMGPVGAILGAGLLTIILSTGVDVPMAAFIAGAVGMFGSGLVMLGCRKVDQNHHHGDVDDDVDVDDTDAVTA
ncbi:MFS transporter [Rhodococcus sp. 21391]|nr:MFS transporter [Rhodococcus sp. 21391]